MPYEVVVENLRVARRLNGKASATIGRLRADLARLRLERAEWRGTVNGDVLVEVLAASAPEGWTSDARRAHAEHVIEAMQASGIDVRRSGQPWQLAPGVVAFRLRPGGAVGDGKLVRVRDLKESGYVTWISLDGAHIGADFAPMFRAPSALDGAR